MRDVTERDHTKAGLRLLAIHEKLGSADESELDSALVESPTEGATTVVIKTMMVSYQTGGDQSRIEYASTRTASSVG